MTNEEGSVFVLLCFIPLMCALICFTLRTFELNSWNDKADTLPPHPQPRNIPYQLLRYKRYKLHIRKKRRQS